MLTDAIPLPSCAAQRQAYSRGETQASRSNASCDSGTPSAGQTPAALGAEAVSLQGVVAAGRAYQPAGRLVLHPAIPVSPVPQTISRPEHPLAALHVPHPQLPNRVTECPSIQGSTAALLDQLLIAELRLTKGIDRHSRQI